MRRLAQELGVEAMSLYRAGDDEPDHSPAPAGQSNPELAVESPLLAADVIATQDPERGPLTIFAVNRSATASVTLDASIIGGERHRVVEHPHRWTRLGSDEHRLCSASRGVGVQHAALDRGRAAPSAVAGRFLDHVPTRAKLCERPATENDPVAVCTVNTGASQRSSANQDKAAPAPVKAEM